MLDNKFLKIVAKGMRNNADALLALVCLVAGTALIVAGFNLIAAVGFPLLIFALYTIVVIKRLLIEADLRALDFD